MLVFTRSGWPDSRMGEDGGEDSYYDYRTRRLLSERGGKFYLSRARAMSAGLYLASSAIFLVPERSSGEKRAGETVRIGAYSPVELLRPGQVFLNSGDSGIERARLGWEVGERWGVGIGKRS